MRKENNKRDIMEESTKNNEEINNLSRRKRNKREFYWIFFITFITILHGLAYLTYPPVCVVFSLVIKILDIQIQEYFFCYLVEHFVILLLQIINQNMTIWRVGGGRAFLLSFRKLSELNKMLISKSYE